MISSDDLEINYKEILKITENFNTVVQNLSDSFETVSGKVQNLTNTYIDMQKTLINNNLKNVIDEIDETSNSYNGLLKTFNDSVAPTVLLINNFDLIKNKVNDVSLFFQDFGEVLMSSNSSLSTVAGSIMNKLGGALSWLATNPVVAVIAAIGAVAGAFALLVASQQETKYEIDDCSQSVQNQIERINDLGSSMENAKISAEDRIVSSEAEITALEKNIDLLRQMGGEDGYVDNITSAQALIDQINSKMPETVKLTEDGRLEWMKMPDAISESIEALKEKARVEAYTQLYTEAVKEQIKAEHEHAKAVQELNEKKQRQTELEAEDARLTAEFNQKMEENGFSWPYSEEGKKYTEQLEKIGTELKELPADIEFLEEGVKTSEAAWESATQTVDVYGEGLSNSKDIVYSTAEAIANLTAEERTSLEAFGNNLAEQQQLLQDYATNSSEINEQEVLNAMVTKDSIIAQYAEKANALGLSYDEIQQLLMEQGIVLDEEEKLQLENSMVNLQNGMSQQELEYSLSKQRTLDVLKEHNANMTAEEELQYTSLLDNLNAFGVSVDATKSEQYARMVELANQNNIDLSSVQGQQYAEFLALLQQNGIEVDSEMGVQYMNRFLKASSAGEEEGEIFIDNLKNGVVSDDISSEAEKLWESGQSELGKPFDTEIDLESASSLKKRVDDILPSNTSFDTVMNINGKLSDGLFSFIGSIGSSFLNMFSGIFANGGFPDTGQLFIAREAGPELVGSIGGRSAVANNGQILQGIYYAVKDAMSYQSAGGDLYLTIQNEDGTKIEKIIHNYNSFMSRTGGRGGFVV